MAKIQLDYDNYKLYTKDGKVFVKDLSGTEDLIELRNVEKVEFADGIFDVETGQFDFVVLNVEPLYSSGETSFKEGEDITIKATLNTAAKTNMTIYIKNTNNELEEILIVKGEKEGTVTFRNPNQEDIYKDPETLEYIIDRVEGGFDNDVKVHYDSHKVEVEVTDTINETGVKITPTITTLVDNEIEINSESIKNPKGFTISAYDHEGGRAEVAVNGEPIGFGVKSKSHKYSGNDVEIGVAKVKVGGFWPFTKYEYMSEKLAVDFEKKIDSLKIGLAWLSHKETAKLQFFDADGKLVDTVTIAGGSDGVDPLKEYKFDTPISRVEFSATGENSDFLVNKIEFTEIVPGEVSSLTPGKDSTIVYEIETEYKPDASKFDFINTFPTATVEVSGITNPVVVNLDKNGKGYLELKTNAMESIEVKVVEINGNFEKVNYDNAVSNIEIKYPYVQLADVTINVANSNTDIDNVIGDIWHKWSDDNFAVAQNKKIVYNEATKKFEEAFNIDLKGTETNSTSNLKIKAISESGIPTLFEVGDKYEVSWLQGKKEYISIMTVTRSDRKSDTGEYKDIVVLTGVVNGKETAIIIDSETISADSNYFKNDVWPVHAGYEDDAVGNIPYTVSGTSFVNADIVIKSKIDGKDVVVGTTTSDANGNWSMNLEYLNGKSGTLKVEATDKFGNTTEDSRNYDIGKFSESNNIVGTDENDFIVGGYKDDVIHGGNGDDIIIGGAGRDEIYGGAGDDTIYTDLNTNNGRAEGDLLIDGGEGYDKIILNGDDNIDLSIIRGKHMIQNIEEIDLTIGDHKLTNIKLEDVIEMTDDRNELVIKGDKGDLVSLDSNDWIKGASQNINGKDYTQYTGKGANSTVKLIIDDEIDVNNI